MKKMTECRACQSTELHLFLPLGDQPPANAFLREEQLASAHATFALDSYVCLDCGLVQVADQLPADFFRNYLYIPSSADTMRAHFRELAATVARRFVSAPEHRVVDIGCNDGTMLGACRTNGVAVLGIDPAENIALLARARGVDVVSEYFSPRTAAQVLERYGPAQVIVTTNTLNHIDDLHAFVRGVEMLLAEDGAFVVEVPQALEFVRQNEFDTIYHEHLSIFSLTSLVALYDFFGLCVTDIELLPIHGGSMRVFAGRKRRGATPTPAVAAYLAREREAGLFARDTYDRFADRVRDIRERLLTLLAEIRSSGKTVAAYGAPAKGNTLLNYYNIGPDTVSFLADRNPLKQGLYSPGMRIPVVPPTKIDETMPDYLLILAWNFGDEIMEQQRDYRARGGRFIVPIPEPRVVA